MLENGRDVGMFMDRLYVVVLDVTEGIAGAYGQEMKVGSRVLRPMKKASHVGHQNIEPRCRYAVRTTRVCRVQGGAESRNRLSGPPHDAKPRIGVG